MSSSHRGRRSIHPRHEQRLDGNQGHLRGKTHQKGSCVVHVFILFCSRLASRSSSTGQSRVSTTTCGSWSLLWLRASSLAYLCCAAAGGQEPGDHSRRLCATFRDSRRSIWIRMAHWASLTHIRNALCAALIAATLILVVSITSE